MMDSKLFFTGAAIFLGLFVILTVLNPPPHVFSNIVSYQTFVKKSDLLYNYEISRYPSTAEITPMNSTHATIGFDTDLTKINFGIIPANGSYSRKVVNITNTAQEQKMIRISARGSIKPYVLFSTPSVRLHPDETQQIEIFFYSIQNGMHAPVAVYTGEIDVVVQTPKYDFVYQFWGSP